MNTELPIECQRRCDEGPKPYAAFLQYAQSGPSRSLAKVGRELGKSTKLLERWSATYSWVSRASAWDRWTQQRRVENTIAEQEAMLERHAMFGKKAMDIAMSQLSRLQRVKLSAAATARLAKVGSAIELEARGRPPEGEHFASVTVVISEHDFTKPD